jgi:hypothetical protein
MSKEKGFVEVAGEEAKGWVKAGVEEAEGWISAITDMFTGSSTKTSEKEEEKHDLECTCVKKSK